MSADIYVSLSGHVAIERRLATIANNIANLGTTGFRAEEVHFEAILSSFRGQATTYANQGDTYLSRRAGALVPTGNPLDLAIVGDAWFAIDVGGGDVAHTRDGRFTLTEAGDLVTATGHAVLDAGGGPIAVDPAAGPVEIGNDGTIAQNGQRVGVVGLFLIPDSARLQRFGDAAVVADADAVPADDLVANGVRQGFLEQANVDPVLEITRLIMVQRGFESVANAIEARDQSLRSAIRQLGPGA